jgi:hypothetical protein
VVCVYHHTVDWLICWHNKLENVSKLMSHDAERGVPYFITIYAKATCREWSCDGTQCYLFNKPVEPMLLSVCSRYQLNQPSPETAAPLHVLRVYMFVENMFVENILHTCRSIAWW